MFVLNFFQLSPKYLFTFDLYESGSNQGSHTDLVGMPQSINTDLFFFFNGIYWFKKLNHRIRRNLTIWTQSVVPL